MGHEISNHYKRNCKNYLNMDIANRMELLKLLSLLL